MASESLSYWQVFQTQILRDLRLNVLKRSEWLHPIVFLVLVQSLFPLALGSDLKQLSQLAPGIIWVSALLSTLISLDSLFRDDFDDGSLEQMLLSPVPFYVFCFAKIACHWLMTGLPLVLVCPLLAASFGLQGESLWLMAMSLLLATPVLCCISALASALTLSVRRGGVLLSLIVLPLYVPVLVFGSGVLSMSMVGESPAAAFYMLAAFLVLALSLTPFVLSAALKLSVSS